MTYKVLLALSGGLDSTVLLAELLKTYTPREVLCVTFDYDARNSFKQIKASNKICERYKVDRLELDATSMIPRKSCALLDSSELPSDPEDSRVKFVLPPAGGLVFLSVLTSYALHYKTLKVAVGFHHEDRKLDLLATLDRVVRTVTNAQVSLYAPFVDWDRSNVVCHGKQVGAPMELTYNCWLGGKAPCRRCAACEGRRRAFEKAKIQDPI